MIRPGFEITQQTTDQSSILQIQQQRDHTICLSISNIQAGKKVLNCAAILLSKEEWQELCDLSWKFDFPEKIKEKRGE